MGGPTVVKYDMARVKALPLTLIPLSQSLAGKEDR